MNPRRNVRSLLAAVPLLLALAGPCAGQEILAPARPEPPTHEEKLLALLSEDLEAQMRRFPTWATNRGDRRFDDRLEDVSPLAEETWVASSRARLERLGTIDRQRLSAGGRLNAALLERELRRRIDGHAFAPWQTPVNQIDGPQQELPQLPDGASFTLPEHFVNYVARLEAVGAHIDQVIENMRAGVRAGRTPPRVVLGGVAAQAAAMGSEDQVRDPSSHPMYKPFRGRPPTDALAARAREAIRTVVIPAFRRLASFLENEYTPRARTTIAASALPDGAAFYAFALRQHTTTEMTAEEIHATGLSEVARIRAEMLETIARSDFPGRGSLSGDELLRAFLAYLREDPRFYYDTPEALLAGYRDVAKRIDAEMPRLFGVLPRLAYGVRPMPDFIAPDSPTAYYRPGSLEAGVAGFFVANTHNLRARPKYEMIPLTLHEAVPGHHHQIAIAREMEGVPEWRETLMYTAYVEGWALYAERLGLEVGGPAVDGSSPDSVYGSLESAAAPGAPEPVGERMARSPQPGTEGYRGMYQHPYDDFGRLTYEMWRAMRLVVDTGIHAMGWTREQAVEYMLANSGLSRQNVEREVDRYIAWPGQATAYKIGELRIRALRATAEAELGGAFDLRAFHDMLLGQGAVPLDVLEGMTKSWIEDRKNGKAERAAETEAQR